MECGKGVNGEGIGGGVNGWKGGKLVGERECFCGRNGGNGVWKGGEWSAERRGMECGKAVNGEGIGGGVNGWEGGKLGVDWEGIGSGNAGNGGDGSGQIWKKVI